MFSFLFLGSALAQDVANVYFYRYRGAVGKALKPSVYINEDEMGRLVNGRYFAVKVKPGTYTFRAEDKQAGASVSIEAGKSYYFRTEVATGFWKGHFRLTMVAPEQGEYDIKQLKPNDPEHVKRERYP
ncbi:MAG: DUF2846 domain-containing protein [Acidobacteriaceae bacterium]|nr:DUF2846 domain-containing protein [Acidobacteriaceae bacterium]